MSPEAAAFMSWAWVVCWVIGVLVVVGLAFAQLWDSWKFKRRNKIRRDKLKREFERRFGR